MISFLEEADLDWAGFFPFSREDGTHAAGLTDVVDRALQLHGSLGYSTDLPLEQMYRFARAARIYDGPDEVHRQTVARRVLKGYSPHEVPTEHIPTRAAEAQRRFADLLADLTVDA